MNAWVLSGLLPLIYGKPFKWGIINAGWNARLELRKLMKLLQSGSCFHNSIGYTRFNAESALSNYKELSCCLFILCKV